MSKCIFGKEAGDFFAMTLLKASLLLRLWSRFRDKEKREQTKSHQQNWPDFTSFFSKCTGC